MPASMQYSEESFESEGRMDESAGIVDVASSGRMEGEPTTTAATSPQRPSSSAHSHAPKRTNKARASAPSDEWIYVHKPRKHGYCYISTYRSQPSVGFGRSKRFETHPRRRGGGGGGGWDAGGRSPSLPPPAHDLKCTQSTSPERIRTPSSAAPDCPRSVSEVRKVAHSSKPTSTQGTLSLSMRDHFLSTPEYVANMGKMLYGTQSPGPYIGPEGVREMTVEGGVHASPAHFKGSTTFGKARLPWQKPNESLGPGPAGVPNLARKGGGGGRFNKNKSMSALERQIQSSMDVPGPASYNTTKQVKPTGGRFSTACPPTELDKIERNARRLPGPADYSTQAPWGFTLKSRIPGGHPLPQGGRVMFDEFSEGFGGRGPYKGQWFIKTLHREMMQNMPGPGYYYKDF